jgi:hypothetical protein
LDVDGGRQVNHGKNIRTLLFSVVGLALLVSYNNCGKGKTADSVNDSFSSIGVGNLNADNVCSEEEIDVFDRGYHQFLAETCKNCHISGPGKGTFASPDKVTAFSGFNMLGYDKISQYAVNNSHNPPYTGSQNLEIINGLRLQWQTFQKMKAQCEGGTGATVENEVFKPQFETSTQTIPQINSTTTTVRVNGSDTQVTTFDRQVLTWDMSNSLSTLSGKTVPTLTGAQLSVTVSGFRIPTGETAYLVSLPILKVGGNSLHIKGLNFRINGFAVGYATTFKKTDINAYMGTDVLLSPGSLVSVGRLGAADTLAVQFGDLEIIDLPAPPPPPAVQFSVQDMTIQANQLGYDNKVTITVNVIGDNLESISVPVNFDGAVAPEKAALSLLGTGQNRFDWDYRVDTTTTTSLTFKPNQKSATFNLIFSDDQRADSDKVLRLSLGTPLGAILATNSKLRISLPNYNAVPTGSAPTFALLMNPKSGVLGMNCVKCHNSVQRQGGYDMTDYQDMKSRGIILPGNLDPNQHKMFRRMNADSPNLQGLQSMPLDGFRPRDEVDLVNQWILDGAKNN